MKEILRQFSVIWRERSPVQKLALLAVLFAVTAGLGYVLFKGSASVYAPLFPAKALSSSETNEVKTFLDRFSIPFKEDQEKRVLVPSEKADQIRQELAETGIPKQETGKGFELFDTNTWIKGEKELQVLEMRALKGQLEKDLSAFEHIKSASVILDIPPQKSFSGTKYTTKASVILTLMPGARLSSSELRAITNHLAGAVRGLEPNMIAISDTTGKLYKAIHPLATDASFHDAASLFEQKLEEKISELLTLLVGPEHFYMTVQAILDKQTENVTSLSIAVVIDKAILKEGQENFQKEIERHLAALSRGYGLDVIPIITYIPFEKEPIKEVMKEKKRPLAFILTLFFILAALAALYPFLRRYKKKHEKEEDSLFRMMTRINVHKLADSLQQEDPQTIAMMLSYLEPARAEQMIAALDAELQDKVLFHLSELEKEQK